MSTGLIHQKLINKIIRSIAHPFRKFLPAKAHFAINGTINIELEDGKSILFNGNPTSNLVRLLFWHGVKGFEYEEYKIFIKLVKKSNILFDIGANIGYYSIVGKTLNPQLKVIAFEPFPSAYNYFKINSALNQLDKEVIVEQIALSDNIGKAQFYVSHNTRMNNITEQLVGDGSLSNDVNKNPNKIAFDVATTTLDAYIASHLSATELIDFIKIDTEATEHLVFKGAENVLKKHRPIIMCEIIKNQIEKELSDIFSSVNYHYYRLVKNGLKKVDSFIIEKAKEDYFLVPAEKNELVKEFVIQ